MPTPSHPKPQSTIRINADDSDNQFFEVIKSNGQVIAYSYKAYSSENRLRQGYPVFLDQISHALTTAPAFDDVPRKRKKDA